MNNPIKNLIIDLGGVMINLDRDRCARTFEKLGLHNADKMLGLYRQEEPFLSVETGRISTAAFYDEIRSIIGRNITDKEIENAFNEFLIDLPVGRLAALRKAREGGLRTYMLSNTNGIMYDGWIKNAFRAEGMQAGDYFDGIVTSFAEGICKPDPEIFSRLLKRYRLNPAETMLLDDSQANCDAAKALGCQATRIIGDHDIISVINSILIQLSQAQLEV